MDQFKTQSEAYIKFLFFHVLIVFTIIFSLLNAILKIEDSAFENKVDNIRKLAQTINLKPETNDYLLNSMYFSKVNDKEGYENSSIPNVGDSLYKETKLQVDKEIHAIENISKDVFRFNLNFLGNINVDLRYWIFILPLFLILSAIYIFILDFKIVIVKKVLGEQIDENQKHPFNFLRNLFLGIELILLVTYLVVFIHFLRFADKTYFKTISWIYILISYYSLIYCLYLKYRLKEDIEKENFRLGFPENLASYAYQFFKKIVSKINTKKPKIAFIGFTQAIILCTLLLTMTKYECTSMTESDKMNEVSVEKTASTIQAVKETKRNESEVAGYELIITTNKWESLSGDTGFPSIFSYVLKYMYILTIIATLFLCFHYSLKPLLKPNLIRGPKLVNYIFYFCIFNIAIFTVYFGNYTFLTTGNIDILIALLILLHWFVFIGKRVIAQKQNNYLFMIFCSLVIYFVPFIISAIITCIQNISSRCGWIFYYPGLWLLFISIIIILRNYNNLSNKTDSS